jgi:hypothetical protein
MLAAACPAKLERSEAKALAASALEFVVDLRVIPVEHRSTDRAEDGLRAPSRATQADEFGNATFRTIWEDEMEKTLGWGILATGWIAELFTQDLVSARLSVAAVGSRSGEKAKAFAERFGIEKAHGSYDQLVANPKSTSSISPRLTRSISARHYWRSTQASMSWSKSRSP